MSQSSSKVQVIQSVTVLSTPNRTYTVGEEAADGRAIIEIKQVGFETPTEVHSEYWVLDEDSELIVSIENCPVIAEYKQIAIDDEDPGNLDITEDDLPF